MNGLLEAGTAEKLLERMREGDREAAAEFMKRMGPRLRRRLGAKLGPEMRRVFDSQEILSTVVRRVDRFVLSRRLRAVSAGEFWSLLCEIGDNALTEKGRRVRTAQLGREAVRAHASSAAAVVEEPLEAVAGEVRSAMASLEDATDRDILFLWLAGRRLVHIAGAVGLAPTAVRKRWQGIRERLRQRLGGEDDR